MNLLFTERIVSDEMEFCEAIEKLKAQAAERLANKCGLPELVPVEYGGTMG